VAEKMRSVEAADAARPAYLVSIVRSIAALAA
jgi:hypothetical protein